MNFPIRPANREGIWQEWRLPLPLVPRSIGAEAVTPWSPFDTAPTKQADRRHRNRFVEAFTSILADPAEGLIDVDAALDAPYKKNAVWIVSQEFMTRVRKLRYVADGAFVLTPGLNESPTTLLGHPYFISSFAVHVFTAGLPVAIIGNFAYYFVAVPLQLQIQRLVELCAEANQTGFIGRFELDAMPVLSKAFVRSVIASQ